MHIFNLNTKQNTIGVYYQLVENIIDFKLAINKNKPLYFIVNRLIKNNKNNRYCRCIVKRIQMIQKV